MSFREISLRLRNVFGLTKERARMRRPEHLRQMLLLAGRV